MILFIDMDNVLADFEKSPFFKGREEVKINPSEMYEQFFFETLPPIKGALSAVRELLSIEGVEIQILTQPVKETHYSYSEKVAWISKWFPELLGKITLTQDKSLLSGKGRVLIDDNFKKWKPSWEEHGGEFIWFDYDSIDHSLIWVEIVKKVRERILETYKTEEQ